MAYEETLEQIVELPDGSSLGFAVSRVADGSLVVDNLLKLLDWFIKNGPALIEVIRLIADLFGGIGAASSILREDFESGEMIE